MIREICARKRSNPVPLIAIQVMEGAFTDAAKARMIETVTKAFGEVAGQSMADATAIRIDEIKNGSWENGGDPLYLEGARAIKMPG
jgi:4-oxalocrotonate tautomerase